MQSMYIIICEFGIPGITCYCLRVLALYSLAPGPAYCVCNISLVLAGKST